MRRRVQVVVDGEGNLIVDPSFVESKFRVRSKTRFSAHSMLAYRRGLANARDLEMQPDYVPPDAYAAPVSTAPNPARTDRK